MYQIIPCWVLEFEEDWPRKSLNVMFKKVWDPRECYCSINMCRVDQFKSLEICSSKIKMCISKYPNCHVNSSRKFATQERPPANLWKKREQSRAYRNGNSLRDYQLEGVNWLLFNWYNRSVISYCIHIPLHTCSPVTHRGEDDLRQSQTYYTICSVVGSN